MKIILMSFISLLVLSISVVSGLAEDASVDPAEGYGEITDIDGNTYQTIVIGNQVWMAENLRVSHFRNGDSIPMAVTAEEWEGSNESGQPAWSFYDNDPELGAAYGILYNRYAMDSECGICPEGWRVPADEDWKQLEMHIGMTRKEVNASGWRGTGSGKLRSTRTVPDPHPRWIKPNEGATNETGFSALPGGYRTGEPNYAEQKKSSFRMLGEEVALWVADGGGRGIWSTRDGIFRGESHLAKGFGFGIRCVRD
jgi:uncharacterized protein (TIGR02145 family)